MYCIFLHRSDQAGWGIMGGGEGERERVGWRRKRKQERRGGRRGKSVLRAVSWEGAEIRLGG